MKDTETLIGSDVEKEEDVPPNIVSNSSNFNILEEVNINNNLINESSFSHGNYRVDSQDL